MKKIILRLFGGLGNQLFCYAAARRLALENKAELVIDDVSGFSYDDSYQRRFQLDHFNISCRKATPKERFEPFSRVRRYLIRRINQCRAFEVRRYIHQEGIDYDPRLLAFVPQDTVYVEGYWQSENYFKDKESTIRDDLKIKPPTDAINSFMAEKILNCTSIAVHVRFFDEPESVDFDNNLLRDYYAQAIDWMELHVPDAHYFIFSDQPQAARASILLPNDRITLISHNKGDVHAYADLWLMTQCKHFIIANSTFSWWGAWLAMHAGKHVIAPGFEVRSGKSCWGFEGFLPEKWLKF